MPACKTCQTKFHACSSCGLTYSYEYEYCSETCWKASSEYKKFREKCAFISNFIPNEHKRDLVDILNNEDASNILLEQLLKSS